MNQPPSKSIHAAAAKNIRDRQNDLINLPLQTTAWSFPRQRYLSLDTSRINLAPDNAKPSSTVVCLNQKRKFTAKEFRRHSSATIPFALRKHRDGGYGVCLIGHELASSSPLCDHMRQHAISIPRPLSRD